jgi:hypothetical protein
VAENHFASALTAMFRYAPSSHFLAKSAQKRRKPNGMVVAQSTAIAFVPTKTWWRG